MTVLDRNDGLLGDIRVGNGELVRGRRISLHGSHADHRIVLEALLDCARSRGQRLDTLIRRGYGNARLSHKALR